MGILSSLFADPTASNGGGGWLLNLLDPQAAAALAAQSGNTPMAAPSSPGTPGGAPTPPPAAQNAQQSGSLLSKFFSPTRGSLGGNSLIGDAIRGGLAGLGSSTGYTGLAALGQGAMGSMNAEAQRRQQQMGSIMAGQQFQQGQNQLAYQPAQLNQQYQQGQQQLVSGNIANQISLLKINGVRQHFGLPPVTINDLNSNPNLVNNPVGQAPTQTAARTPLRQPAQGQAPQQPAGMAPIVGGQPSPGQTPNNPQVTAAYPQGGSVPGVPSAGAQPNANQQGIVTPTPQQLAAQGSISGAPDQIAARQAADQGALPSAPSAPQADPYATMQAHINDMWNTGQWDEAQKQQVELDKLRAAPQQAAAVQQSQQFSPSGINKNLSDLRQQYTASKPVQVMQEVQPIYDEAMAADKAHRTAKNPEEQLASDMDLANATLKLMNPNSANLRANTTEAVEEAKGYAAIAQKAIQTAVLGGTALTNEVRAKP